MKPKIAVCASGEGTNFEALVTASREGRLHADIVGLITNRSTAGVLERATRLKIPTRVLTPKGYADRAEWDRAMVAQLDRWQAEWVVLAGFLTLIGPQVLARFPGHIVNSHPALLPKFGGEGMYGDHVHTAVLNAGEAESGVTIHKIDAIYDQGAIVAQERVPVLPGDDLESLRERVKALEISMYPRVLNDLVKRRS